MTEACQQVLGQAGYTDVQIHTLPGSLEIPLAARDLLAQDVERQIDAIICFGVIIGATPCTLMIEEGPCVVWAR